MRRINFGETAEHAEGAELLSPEPVASRCADTLDKSALNRISARPIAAIPDSLRLSACSAVNVLKGFRYIFGLESNAGFVMLELALSVLVIAIGVLALFGLFRLSTDTVEQTQADTRAALFAQEVMSGLRAESERRLSSCSTSETWEAFWDDMTNGYGIPVACGGPVGVWADPSLAVVAGEYTTNSYTNVAVHAGIITNIVSHSLRYRLDITATNTTPLPYWTNRILATLYVWDGLYGSTSNSDAVIFYSEFGRIGEVP
jgi:type II secretory pathway pseudopilin PulG